MSRSTLIQGIVLCCAASVAQGALTFTPAPGYTAQTVWSGAEASHFAVKVKHLSSTFRGIFSTACTGRKLSYHI